MSLLGGYWGKIKVLSAYQTTVRNCTPPDVAKRLDALQKEFGYSAADQAKQMILEAFGRSNLTKESHTVGLFLFMMEFCKKKDEPILRDYLHAVLIVYLDEFMAVLPKIVVDSVIEELGDGPF